jgi:hypothetical protein
MQFAQFGFPGSLNFLTHKLSDSKCHTPSPKPFGLNLGTEVEVEVNLRPIVSRPVCPGVRRPSGTRDQFFFLLEISFRQLRLCYFVAPSLARGRVCNLLYNCFWTLPEQSLLARSPTELTAIFYCLIWDSPILEGQVPVFISLRTQDLAVHLGTVIATLLNWSVYST